MAYYRTVYCRAGATCVGGEMTHADKITNRRQYESERALVYDLWLTGSAAKLKDVKTPVDRQAIANAARVVDWFEERYNIDWEDALKEIAKGLRR